MIRGEWPLVGRADELDRMGDLLRRAAPGAVVTGASRIGKTRLANEFARLAAEQGYHPIRITGDRVLSATPLGALATLLGVEVSDAELDRPTASTLRRVAEVLATTPGPGGVALIVDDAHLFDDVSAALVGQLMTARRISLVVVADRVSSLPAALGHLCESAGLESVELLPLAPESLTEALSLVLGSIVDPAVALRLTAISGDDLVVFRELARGAVEDGTLRDEDGIWRLTAPVSLPQTVIDLVERELDQLDPAERSVLDLVALGEPVGSAELTLLHADLVSALERRGFLACRRNERRLEIRISRSLHARVLRTQLPTVSRLTLTGQLAGLVESHGSRRKDDVLRLAVWQLDGDTADLHLLIAAATRARETGDLALAEHLARAATRMGGGFESRLLAAQLAEQQGRNEDAEAEFTALSADAANDAERGQLAVDRITHLLFKVGDFTQGRSVAEAALRDIADPAWRSEISALMAGVLTWTDGAQVAWESVAPLLERAEGRTLATAGLVAAGNLYRQGRLSEAVEVSIRGYAAHRALEEPVSLHPATHLVYHCDALVAGGRFGEAGTVADAAYEEALATGDTEGQALLAFRSVRAIGDRGDVVQATRRAREAVAAFRAIGRLRFVKASMIYLATALAVAGDTAAAEAALTGPDAPDLTFANDADLYLAWAWVAANSGNLPQARKHVELAIEAAHRVGHVVRESVSWHAYARFGKPTVAAPRLEQLARVVEGELSSARARHAIAMASADPLALEASSDEFAKMGADLLAAEAAIDAAVQWRRQGDTRRATASERLASILAARCEGAHSPALLAVGPRATMTSAERDAALLAAGGMSNRDIATSLGLSVRTIENQLQRVYSKLGVSSRAELKTALREPD